MVHISATIAGCLLMILIATGLLGGARYSVSRLLGDRDNQSFLLCGTVAFLYWNVMTLGAWLLFFGVFGFHAVIILSLMGMATYLLNGQPGASPLRLSRLEHPMRLFPLKPTEWVLFAVMLLLTAFTCIRAVLAPVHGWDASTYHLPKSVWWVKNGVMSLPQFPGGWEFHKYEFGAVELLHALIIIPFGTPLLVNLPDVLAYILCGVISLLIADRLMPIGRARYLAVILVLSSPTIKLLVGSCYVELHTVLLVLCAFLPLGEFYFAGNYRHLYIVSAVVGCLAASKILFLPLAAAYCVLLLYSFLKRKIRFSCLATASTIAIMPVLPWLLHNFLSTGNPIAPFPLKLFGMSIFEGHLGLNHLIALYSVIDSGISAELAALGKIAFEMGIGFIAALYFYLRSLSSVWWWISCALLALTWGSFYRPEMSIVRLVWSESRLIVAGTVPAVLVGTCSNLMTRGVISTILATIVLVQNLVVTLKGVAPFEYLPVAGGACIILIGFWLSRFHQFGRSYRGWCVTLIAFVCYTSWIQSLYYSEYLHKSFIYNDDQRYWADAALSVQTGGPYTIAIATGLESRGDNQKFFPFFGQHLQNSLVYVSPAVDGKEIYPLKENRNYQLDARLWKDRLKAARVTHVMSYYPLAFELPFLEQDGNSFKRLEGGEGWGFYEINYDNR
jgi:hypothetical protein